MRKFRFSISAQAMVRSGKRVVLWLLLGVNSIRLLFFPATRCRAVSCTFTMTAPSLRCRLTFLPMYDLALLELKDSMLPVLFLVGDFVPALLADGQFFAFYLDVEFDVFAFAAFFPGVFTMFHFFVSEEEVWWFVLLRGVWKRLFGCGEGWVKVKSL